MAVAEEEANGRSQFPPWLETQTEISGLSLANASISGIFPDWFGTNFASLSYLDLSSNFLTGPVPLFDANYSTYSSFEFLNLASNRLTGSIPDELCNLHSLMVISLANNQLTGKIPACLGNLKQLIVLNLANNRLSGHIPGTLGNLESLQQLRLNGNKFFGVLPSSLQSLKSLITLDLRNNQLRDLIPDWIGKEFSNLRFLMLQTNNFNGNLSMMLSNGSGGLTTFGVYMTSLWNSMKGTDLEYFSNLQYVKSIMLSGNNLGGEIPDELMDLKCLLNLNLSRNNLVGKIPEKIGNLKQLESLDLSMNQLSETIPQSLTNIDALSYLNLSFNNLTGRIPSGNHFDTLNDPSIYEGNSGLCGKPLAKSCHGNAASNQAIDDDNDKFEFLWFYSGIGPGFAVGLLGFFLVLYINKSWRHAYFRSVEYVCNRVRGRCQFCETALFISMFSKPDQSGRSNRNNNRFLSLNVNSQWIPPFQLQELEMVSVFIGTEYPHWLRTQSENSWISLRNASISGSLPSWCATTSANLYYFDLSDNFLTGHVPVFDVNQSLNFQSLRIISLANNQLTGKIPSCLGNLRQLKVLDLANNSLSGQIPHTLGNLGWLLVLHLNGNKLFGTLPSSLKNLTLLTTLDLGNNQFRDFIPDWMGEAFLTENNLHLRLQSNHFYGNISENLCQLSSLQVLNLAENDLVGSIPRCLGNLSMLLSDEPGSDMEYFTNLQYVKSMMLSGNNLDGEIPDELMDLKGLQNLNLSRNNLSGKIPGKIGDLKQLESLDLSMNQLSGTIPQSLANIDALSYLNLSFNNLTGHVPSGNHFDTLNDPSIYEGNSGLCSNLAVKICPDDSPARENELQLRIEELTFSWFYYGIGPGFAIGFLGVFYVLHLKKSWRHAYFRLVENACDKVRVSSQWIPPFQLVDLRMDSVFIGTQFPPWLQTQRKIFRIALTNASISGSLPLAGWWGTTSADLDYIDLSNNFLTGHLPVFDVKYTINSRFQFLKLSNNRFTGNIPEQLCNLQSLWVISLANNNLTGKIPPCLGNLKQLKVLDLANNSLSGQIPYTLGNLGWLNVLHLNGNNLFGVLPSSLKNLTFLITLDLGNNEFRDLIPDWMGKEFSSLQFLRLQSNSFYVPKKGHLKTYSIDLLEK
ncbi:OLC1v1004516C1 [Oldenlandia corymbosa var. corymbosa]|uniref:OLC1v1004516C1 n=1 Tax=Oldenlandia corymbosa var. corymbosa TaxID=529605 RepID=A0AAV1DF54_OLDCO|nr:OLC1v1004516C1 [Oldenlandia corymbosa var. corymbosa]